MNSLTSSVRLRVATRSDAAILAAISIEVWLGTYLRKGVNAFFANYALREFTSDRFKALLENPDEHVIVSENEDGLDGFIRISRGKPVPVMGCAGLEIATLYVQPRHHGRGLGQALLSAGLEHARTVQEPGVWLVTAADNDHAKAFYRARGFQNAGTSFFRIEDQSYLNDVFQYSFSSTSSSSV